MSDTKTYCGHLSGVKCQVTNCKYHTAENCCSAQRIQVQNENAQQKAETFCSTFAPQSGISC